MLWKQTQSSLQAQRGGREWNGQRHLIFLAEPRACVDKMEFASPNGIILGANFSRGHPSLPQAESEWALRAPLSSSWHSRVGSAGSAKAWLYAHLQWSSGPLDVALRQCCSRFSPAEIQGSASLVQSTEFIFYKRRNFKNWYGANVQASQKSIWVSPREKEMPVRANHFTCHTMPLWPTSHLTLPQGDQFEEELPAQIGTTSS